MTYLPTSHYSCLSTVCIVKMAGWTGYSCCDKILDKSNSRNEGFFLFCFITVFVVGKTREQECEVAGHMSSIVRKLRAMNAGSQLSIIFLVLPWMVSIIMMVGLPTSIHPVELLLTYVSRIFFLSNSWSILTITAYSLSTQHSNISPLSPNLPPIFFFLSSLANVQPLLMPNSRSRTSFKREKICL